MKKLLNCLIAIAIVFSFTSCFDDDDKKFEAGFSGKFIIQSEKINGTDTVYTYTPYFQIVSSRLLQSYSVKSDKVDTAKQEVVGVFDFPMKPFLLENVRTYYYYSDMSNPSYPVIESEFINKGPYRMRIKTVDGKTFTQEDYFTSFKLDTLGSVQLTKVDYVAANVLEIYLKPVKGAVDYALFISPEAYLDFRSVFTVSAIDAEGKKLIRVMEPSLLAELGNKIYIRVAATNGGRIVRESEPILLDLEKDFHFVHSNE